MVYLLFLLALNRKKQKAWTTIKRMLRMESLKILTILWCYMISKCLRNSCLEKYSNYQTVSINVYDYDTKFNIRPLRVSDQYNAVKNIDLLYILN